MLLVKNRKKQFQMILKLALLFICIPCNLTNKHNGANAPFFPSDFTFAFKSLTPFFPTSISEAVSRADHTRSFSCTQIPLGVLVLPA